MKKAVPVVLVVAVILALASMIAILVTNRVLPLAVVGLAVAVFLFLGAIVLMTRRQASGQAVVIGLSQDTAERLSKVRTAVETMPKRLSSGKSGIPSLTRGLVVQDTSALLDIHALLSLNGEPVTTTTWSATPQTLLALVGLVDELPDGALIVEAGSGLSTMWLALAIAKSGRSISVVSLEHDGAFAEETRQSVARQGVSSNVEVRHAPLVPVSVGGVEYSWYEPSTWSDLKGISVLFVDGPPHATGAEARFPAVPLLAGSFADGAVVILDDTDRDDEKAVLQRWMAETDGGGALEVERVYDRTTQLRYRRAAH
jgi:hypothetical protein